MIDGIKNFDARASAHRRGDAKGRSLDNFAWETAVNATSFGFGGNDLRQVRYVAARQAIAGFIEAEAIHVPTDDDSEQVLIATGLDPHTATAEQVDAAMDDIRERILGHIGLIQNKDISTGGEATK